MTLLSVDGLVAGYGPTRILNGVDLKVAHGEIVTVLGANGSGKSTLLKTIAGVLKPESGRVTFEGEELQGWPTHRIARKGLSFVPQSRNAFPSLTVEENLKIQVAGPKGAHETAYDIFPQLAEYRRRRAGLLSGGGRQMLGIAMGIISQPRLLILDEPTAALSPKMADLILGKVAQEIRPRGIPVLLVEQRVAEALAISDRAYVMGQGRVLREGAIADFSSSALADIFLS